MRAIFATSAMLAFAAAAAAQQTTTSDANAATWGSLLWIVIVLVLAVGFIAVAAIGLRSSTKQKD
jgi:hypothetical protein